MIDAFVHGKVGDVHCNLRKQYCVVVAFGSHPHAMTTDSHFVVMYAVITCNVGCRNLSGAFVGSCVVACGESILRLSVRFPLVLCDSEPDSLSPTLRWVVKVEYAWLKNA